MRFIYLYRHKPYHSTNTFLSSLPNTLSHKTHSPQIQTQQRSPDSTTDTSNVTYLHYPASGTYLQVPIPIEQSTAESLSSSHSSQHSGGSPHQTIAYALPTNLGYGYQAGELQIHHLASPLNWVKTRIYRMELQFGL